MRKKTNIEEHLVSRILTKTELEMNTCIKKSRRFVTQIMPLYCVSLIFRSHNWHQRKRIQLVRSTSLSWRKREVHHSCSYVQAVSREPQRACWCCIQEQGWFPCKYMCRCRCTSKIYTWAIPICPSTIVTGVLQSFMLDPFCLHPLPFLAKINSASLTGVPKGSVLGSLLLALCISPCTGHHTPTHHRAIYIRFSLTRFP